MAAVPVITALCALSSCSSNEFNWRLVARGDDCDKSGTPCIQISSSKSVDGDIAVVSVSETVQEILVELDASEPSDSDEGIVTTVWLRSAPLDKRIVVNGTQIWPRDE